MLISTYAYFIGHFTGSQASSPEITISSTTFFSLCLRVFLSKFTSSYRGLVFRPILRSSSLTTGYSDLSDLHLRSILYLLIPMKGYHLNCAVPLIPAPYQSLLVPASHSFKICCCKRRRRWKVYGLLGYRRHLLNSLPLLDVLSRFICCH
jgi:hypothetical protein